MEEMKDKKHWIKIKGETNKSRRNKSILIGVKVWISIFLLIK